MRARFNEREQRAIEKLAEKLGMTPQQLLEQAVTEYLNLKKEQYGS